MNYWSFTSINSLGFLASDQVYLPFTCVVAVNIPLLYPVTYMLSEESTATPRPIHQLFGPHFGTDGKGWTARFRLWIVMKVEGYTFLQINSQLHGSLRFASI